MTPTSHRRRAVLILALVVAVVGCGSDDATEPSLVGVVRFVDVEGGCWTIVSGSETYEPIELDDEFQVDGLEVAFDVEERADLASTCMVGTLVEVTDIAAVAEAEAGRE